MSSLTMHQTVLDQLRCVLCRNFFSPPHSLPHLLPCTHYLCTLCLTQVQHSQQQSVFCPEDLESSSLKDIRVNCPARKALERLVKEHSVFSQNNQLISIQSLTKHFESVLEGKNRQKAEFKELIQRIIGDEIKRLGSIHQGVLDEMDGPFRLVSEWKEMVKEYLSSLKGVDRACRKEEISSELNYYIEQGRRIKSDLAKYQGLNFNDIGNIIAVNPTVCLRNEFTLQKYLQGSRKDTELLMTEHSFKEGLSQSLPDKAKSRVSSQAGLNGARKRTESKEEEVSEFSRHPLLSRNNEENKLHQLLASRQRPSGAEESQCSRKDTKEQENSQEGSFLMCSLSASKREREPEQVINQNLLTEKEEKKAYVPQQINFLEQWEIRRQSPSQQIEVERREPYDWQKERNRYIRKLQLIKVEQAISHSSLNQNCLQLINYDASDLDLDLYLQHWDRQTLEVIKLVKTGLGDQQLNQLLNFTLDSKVETLVLSGNHLGEISLDALLNYKKMSGGLRNVYLSKNCINLLRGRTRAKISLLKQQGVNLYI